MTQHKPDWMNEEEERAEDLQESGETANNTAPKLARVTKAPPRMQKAFYIQDKYANAFDDLAFKQKKAKGKKAPDLAEEAIKLLLEKYGVNTENL